MKELGLLDAYRKLRSMIQRPVWLTAGSARPMSTSGEEIEIHDDESITHEAVHEAADTSHVRHPPAELTPHDEAVEILARRLDVIASRADRLERSVEEMSPVKISQMPSRAEFSAVAELAAANRKRGEELARQLDDLTESHALSVSTLDDNRAALMSVMAAKTKTNERLRDLGEELSDLRRAAANANTAIESLRDHLMHRGSADVSEMTRRLAGVYTVAIVALLAALVTLALVVTK